MAAASAVPPSAMKRATVIGIARISLEALRYIADPQPVLPQHRAGIRFDDAEYDLDERRFTGAVGSDDGNDLALSDVEIDARQDRPAAAMQREIADRNERVLVGSGLFMVAAAARGSMLEVPARMALKIFAMLQRWPDPRSRINVTTKRAARQILVFAHCWQVPDTSTNFTRGSNPIAMGCLVDGSKDVFPIGLDHLPALLAGQEHRAPPGARLM